MHGCIIIDRSCRVRFMDDLAKFIATVKSFSDIEGQKFSTKFINDHSLVTNVFKQSYPKYFSSNDLGKTNLLMLSKIYFCSSQFLILMD